MNELLLKLLEKATTNLKPDGEIHNLYSYREKVGLAQRLHKGVEELTDNDIKEEFARKVVERITQRCVNEVIQ